MMIGKTFLKKSFDQGLSNLKALLEADPPAVASLGAASIETQEAMTAMVIKEGSNLEDLSAAMESMFGRLMSEVQAQELIINGPAFADYLDMDMSTGDVTLVVGVPVAEAGKASGDVVPVAYNEMQVVTAIHTGSYDGLHDSYGKMQAYVYHEGLEVTGEAFEFYLVDPMSEPDPAGWKTRISFPLK
jgi:effector-binding domain-containing protein